LIHYTLMPQLQLLLLLLLPLPLMSNIVLSMH
jgi:hypothetical protein